MKTISVSVSSDDYRAFQRAAKKQGRPVAQRAGTRTRVPARSPRFPPVTLAVTPLVPRELVHVITDPGRFEPPVTMIEALAVARLYVGRSNVTCLPIDEEKEIITCNTADFETFTELGIIDPRR